MTHLDNANPLDDGFFDRIADGELSAAELGAAIDRLEREPDGWKRCALAFLEDQCWQRSVQAMESSASVVHQCHTSSLPSVTASRRRWIRGPIAAGIVAASFAMGWVGRAGLPWPALDSLVVGPSDAIPDATRTSLPPRPVDHDGARFAARQQDAKESLPTVNDVIQAVGRVRVGPQSTGADVPILAGPGMNEQWLKNQPPPLTEHSQVALQRSGYQVDQSRRLVSTTLADGRRVTIPIDEVQIRYTGNNPL